jgi:hypothetical protein
LSEKFHFVQKTTPELEKALPTATPFKVGGDEEDRTPGLGIANAALSQLSYIPSGIPMIRSALRAVKLTSAA